MTSIGVCGRCGLPPEGKFPCLCDEVGRAAADLADVKERAARAPFITKDSGVREEFPTGSRRDTRVGKGRYDLISVAGLRRLALVMERGAEKYGPRNWEKGQPMSRYLDSALRHIYQYVAGDRDEDHLAQAAFNIFAMLHTVEKVAVGELPKELDDV